MKSKLLFVSLLGFLAAGNAFALSPQYGVEATKWQVNDGRAGQGRNGGNLKHCLDTFVLTADLNVGDIIRMCRIPAGARVVNVKLATPGLGAGLLDVGYSSIPGEPPLTESNSTAGFMTRIGVTTIASNDMVLNSPIQIQSGFMKLFSDQMQAVIKVHTDTSATSGTIYLEVIYVVD